jgi:hypothetical protein
MTIWRGVEEFFTLALLPHLAVGAWMLSNPSIFASQDLLADIASGSSQVVGSSITRRIIINGGVLPMMACLLALIAVLVVRQVLKMLGGVLRRVLAILSCGQCDLRAMSADNDARFRSENPLLPLPAALSRGVLRGVRSYNPVANPTFEIAFAMGPAAHEVAMQGGRLRDAVLLERSPSAGHRSSRSSPSLSTSGSHWRSRAPSAFTTGL